MIKQKVSLMIVLKNQNTPINYDIVKNKIANSGIKNIGKASIRELVSLVNDIELETNKSFIRMEMGVPGLAPPEVGTNAEIKNGRCL